MAIIDLFEKEPPLQSKVNIKGKDKTPIEADGGLDLSKNEKALKDGRNGEIGQGTPRGYTQKKPYSSLPRK
jgi:hypothetical protein